MIFIDSGPLIARVSKRDQDHRRAIRGWAVLEGERLVTTSLVVAETLNIIGHRLHPKVAVQTARVILGSHTLEIIRPTAAHDVAALAWMERFVDLRLGFVDAVSFTVMAQRKIDLAFTFDTRHFGAAGLSVWSGDA